MGLIIGGEDPLEKGIGTHSSILVWRISWTEEPGRYSPQSCTDLDPLSYSSTIAVWVISGLSTPMIYICFCASTTLYDCSYVIQFKSGHLIPPGLFFFLKLSLGVQGILFL